ncbi:MAG: glycogen/starch synthase, partial [Oscillospiraceae bacterium]
MNVLYCTSEATPFAASGGLGDVAGSLPTAIRACKVNCRVVMPLYGA